MKEVTNTNLLKKKEKNVINKYKKKINLKYKSKTFKHELISIVRLALIEEFDYIEKDYLKYYLI